jgi:thiol-disulfide isomerase/thioredoxin
MKHIIQISLALLISSTASAQNYTVGDIVQDYTFTDYNSGQSVSLYELGAEGGVLVLEWFAFWCPFCTHAAANVETGIVEHYANLGGNPYGLPVKHIGLNVDNRRQQSDIFIQSYGFQTVMEDYSRTFFREFSSSGQPLFVIINAEPNSPSADQWEVIFVQLTYGSYPDISALMRPVIDSIQPGIPPLTFADAFPGQTPDPEGWFNHGGFGPLHDSGFPFVFLPDLGFLHVESNTDGSLLLWNPDIGWFTSGPDYFPYLYDHQNQQWALFDSNTSQIIPI